MGVVVSSLHSRFLRCNELNFKAGALWKLADFNAAPGGSMATKARRIKVIDDGYEGHVCGKECRFDDVLPVTVARLKNGLAIIQCLLNLCLRVLC